MNSPRATRRSHFRSLPRPVARPRLALSGAWRMLGVCGLLLSLCGLASPARAQQAAEKLVAAQETEIRAGQEIVGRLYPGEQVEVRAVKGPWVGIRGRLSGWVFRAHLLTAEQAAHQFELRLRQNPRDPGALLARARAALEQSERLTDRAIQDLTAAAREDATRGDFPLERARLWRKKNQPSRALADYEQAIQLRPFDAEPYQELADFYLERGDYRRAVANYGEVIRLRPWQAAPYADRGWAQYQGGEYPEAEADLAIAARLQPNDALLHYRLGQVRLRLLESSRAMNDFQRALELNPRLAEARLARGLMYEKEGRLGLAHADYNEAVRLNPHSAEAREARAKLRLAAGDFDFALDDLTQVIRLNPRRARVWFERGEIYLARGQGTEAIADFQAAARVDASYLTRKSDVFVNAYRLRAKERTAAGQFLAAAEDYTAALAVTPDDLDLLAARGECYVRQKDFSRGLADLTAVTQGRSEDPRAWFARAHAWYLAGRYGRSAVDYRKSILVDPTFIPAYVNLSWLLATCPDETFRNGKLALRYANYACELTGWKQYAILDTLAAAYAEEGNFHEAIKWQSAVVYMAPVEEQQAFRSRLDLYGALKPYREVRDAATALTAETDTAGVLAQSDANSVENFAASIGLELPDLEALEAEMEAKTAQEGAQPAGDGSQTPAQPAATKSPDKTAPAEGAPAPESDPTAQAPTSISTPTESPAKAPSKPAPAQASDSLDLKLEEMPDEEQPADSAAPARPITDLTKLQPDNPQALAALKKLGGRTSERITGETQSLGLQYTKFTDKEVELLAGLPSLEILDLTFTKIGEPTLKQLGKMKQLKLLVLDQTQLNDDLLKHLADLPNLEVLSVKATPVSGKGIKHVEKLPKLNMVLINGTRVTGAELKEFGTTMPKVKFMR